MAKPFVHIHNHTEYSLLDGANRIDELVRRAAEFEMPALAITDHGVMFGAMEFVMACKDVGIKPIVGMEAYVAPGGRLKKTGKEENETYHLLLLAKNSEGYRNLCKLHTVAALEGFYYKPRIDHELLRQHSKGLIGTSACLGSEICQYLLANNYEKAQHLAGMYKEIFGEGNFYIELQDHGLPEQAAIKPQLLKIAKEVGLPLVATNDAHYLCEGDASSHDVLLCIGTGALVSDEKRLRFEREEFYLKSPEEMAKLFSDTPEAVENTLQIAQACELEIGKEQSLMPDPALPPNYDATKFLRELAEKGLEERIPASGRDEASFERLSYELGVIEKTGFENYFLLVREFAQFTRQQDIMFGVRGSAAGSLVSYCIGITDVNPLEYDLTFERFLNPERVSMPDIDMDFQDDRRDEVIRYVSEKYGQDRVAQIITFGTLGAKAAIKDAGRVLGYSPVETDKICKTIPTMPGMTIHRAMEESAEFRSMTHSDPKVHSLVETAKRIEGLARHAGVHAAGVVISRDPLDEVIPLYKGADGQPVTAYEMGILEKLGLLKMDFLGLSNLTLLARTIQNIRERHVQKADWDEVTRAILEQGVQAIPDGDAKTFDLLSRGETIGVFQLESAGMRRYIVELKPQSIRELAAMVALYRPGPMEHIPRYIDNKFGRRKPEYLDEHMRPILEETYGVIVYQDQVLKLVQALAGFTLGKADILRRAMGKKDRAQMASMKQEFLAGTQTNNIAKETAEKVWELLLPFAGYAFNKAHAVCYAILAYQTAFLKANYPVEYMAALLAVYRGKEDRVTSFIEECRRMKIPVLPPDINASFIDFHVEEISAQTIGSKGSKKAPLPMGGQAIRFGLAAIKGVGEGLVEAILKERKKTPFSHLYEFAERLRPSGLNKGSLEALTKAGALASIETNRHKLVSVLEGALSFADIAARDRASGQDSLFESNSGKGKTDYPVLPEKDAYPRSVLLAMEKEFMGVYVSDHPLRGYGKTLAKVASHPCAMVSELEDGTSVTLAGVVTHVRSVLTKKGDRMATTTFEDLSGQAQLTFFADPFARYKEFLKQENVLKITGVVRHRENMRAGGEKIIEVRVDSLEVLPQEEESENDEEQGLVTIRINRATRDQLEELKRIILANPGDYGITLQMGTNGSTCKMPLIRRVSAAGTFLAEVRETLPSANVAVRGFGPGESEWAMV